MQDADGGPGYGAVETAHFTNRTGVLLPNGTSVTSDSGDVDGVLSAFFGRDVTLARAAPASTSAAVKMNWSRPPTG